MSLRTRILLLPSKFNANKIYNAHFSGSTLWNLFSCEAIKVESTWKRSVKFIQWFLNFMKEIKRCSKAIVKILFNTIKLSVRITVAYNLRIIMNKKNEDGRPSA